MSDILLRIGLSNLLISLAIAVVAWAVQAWGKHPRIAHLLWLLVLVKLVTPPIVTLPVFAAPGPVAIAAEPLAAFAGPGPAAAVDASVATANAPLAAAVPSPMELAKTTLALLWLIGSAWILAWSLVRILRFHRLLGTASEAAPPRMQSVASGLAECLGLRTVPTIYATSAHLSPMVWWIGGRVRVLVPAGLQSEMDADMFRWVIAHELAHVRRRDHLVRWLEWLACVAFWWNPVAWWARRNLRANEEICCDALVLSSLAPNPRTYANSLLTAVEFLASPALRPPAMASEINSGGLLERRFKMIVSTKPIRTTPRWLQVVLLLVTLAVLPLGLAQAKEPDFDAVGKRLREAVGAGELTPDQARAMIHTLKIDYYRSLERRLTAAVTEGKMSREDAGKRLVELRKRLFGGESGERRVTREDYAKAEAELKKLVEAGKVSEADAKRRLDEMRKAMGGGERKFSREDYAKAEAEIRKLVEAGKVSEEDAKRRLEEMRKTMGGGKRSAGSGLAGHYKRLGIDKAGFDRIRKVLTDRGLSAGQADKAMGAMLRIAHEMKSEGESFELDPKLKEWLVKEARLTEEQVKLVLRASRRIAAASNGAGERRRPPEGDK